MNMPKFQPPSVTLFDDRHKAKSKIGKATIGLRRQRWKHEQSIRMIFNPDLRTSMKKFLGVLSSEDLALKMRITRASIVYLDSRYDQFDGVTDVGRVPRYRHLSKAEIDKIVAKDTTYLSEFQVKTTGMGEDARKRLYDRDRVKKIRKDPARLLRLREQQRATYARIKADPVRFAQKQAREKALYLKKKAEKQDGK